MRIVHVGLAFFILILSGAGRAQDSTPQTIEGGPLKLEVYVSPRTATLFHVVDQLSEWSEFCHKQYGRYFQKLNGGYSTKDRELSAKHTAIRKVRGWAGGLEQTFYTPLDLDAALKLGVKEGRLTEEQASIEREVLTQFSARVEDLMKKESKTLDAFAVRLSKERDSLCGFAEKFSRFCGGVQIAVPVYLLANPSEQSCGGGYNGGRLTLEIPSGRDVYPSFLHELMHAFLDTQRDRIEKAAQGVKGLDRMGLGEGIAYALSPGIVRAGSEGDPLAADVREDVKAQKPLTDNYTRFRRLGLALRPMLRDALDDDTQTLTTFLPRAADAWRVIAELDLAMRGGTPGAQGGKEHRQITITKAYWLDSEETPPFVKSSPNLKRGDGAGHLFIHGDEWFEGMDHTQYGRFREAADKEFVLKADGHPDVACALSGWLFTNPGEGVREFEIVIPPREYAKMTEGVAYALCPVNSSPTHQWKAKEGVTVTKGKPK